MSSSPDDVILPPDEDILYDASESASAAAATSSGPPPSSETPGPIQEPLPQPGSDEQQNSEESKQPPEGVEPQAFDPRHKEPFIGLMFLGSLEKTVTVWGHSFHLATASQAEKIEVGLLHKEYQGTLASEIAYQTLMVAAYLRWVDDEELPKPVTNSTKDQAVSQRYQWVANNLKDEVIDELFSQVLVLQQDVRDVLAAMSKASG